MGITVPRCSVWMSLPSAESTGTLTGGTSLLHWILPWHLAGWVSRYDKGDSSQTARSYFLLGQILSPNWWGVYERNRPHLWTIRFSPTLGTDRWEGRVVRKWEEFSISEVTVALIAKVIEKEKNIAWNYINGACPSPLKGKEIEGNRA